jgi:hypothetical protein
VTTVKVSGGRFVAISYDERDCLIFCIACLFSIAKRLVLPCCCFRYTFKSHCSTVKMVKVLENRAFDLDIMPGNQKGDDLAA